MAELRFHDNAKGSKGASGQSSGIGARNPWARLRDPTAQPMARLGCDGAAQGIQGRGLWKGKIIQRCNLWQGSGIMAKLRDPSAQPMERLRLRGGAQLSKGTDHGNAEKPNRATHGKAQGSQQATRDQMCSPWRAQVSKGAPDGNAQRSLQGSRVSGHNPLHGSAVMAKPKGLEATHNRALGFGAHSS